MPYDTIQYLYVTDVAKHLGVRFLYGACSPREDFELILTVKMETIHPVEDQFGW